MRLRYAPQGAFDPDFSYAIDPSFHAGQPDIEFREDHEQFRMNTPLIQCALQKRNAGLLLADSQHRILLQEKIGYAAQSSILQGLIQTSVSFEKTKTDLYYGLGDKSGPLRLNGMFFENWNTDAYAYRAGNQPLYKSIPFFFGLREGQAYGVFLDNTFPTRFDFGASQKDELRIETAGGEMRYYFIYGPSLLEVAAHYALLTGRPELPPRWALGFHQSRWSYFPETRVIDVAENFRKRRIPCDAIYLDIDYMDGFRCFTWDSALFPNPAELAARLRGMGLQTVVMIDPGIKIDPDYQVYNEGLERDAFCRRSDGDLMTGPVWPGECVFPDFTHPGVREWWGTLYRQMYLEQGIAGFWNDMNEPAVFQIDHLTFPDEVVHHYDGRPSNHRKAHNIYGQQMARATYEGLKRLDPERRPFILTRASFAGGQRHAATWTGDNVSSWEHLRIAHIQAQRMGISGYGFCGSDIGGFAGELEGELLLRWLQMGVFHPYYRVHSMGNHAGGAVEADAAWVASQEARNRLDQEPWAFGPEWEGLNRQAIEWRYLWLPYLYTALWNWIETGEPMLKSLVFLDQNDPELYNYEAGVWVGPDVLVYPVFAPGQKSKTVYLPKGSWCDYWTGKIFQGKGKYRLKLRLDRLPIFVRAGAIIPHYPVRQHTGEAVEEVVLKIYPGPPGVYTAQLYEDAGEGYGYRRGEFALFRFEQHIGPKGASFSFTKEGNYEPPYRLRAEFISSPSF